VLYTSGRNVKFSISKSSAKQLRCYLFCFLNLFIAKLHKIRVQKIFSHKYYRDIRSTVKQEDTSFPVAETIDKDGLGNLYVTRCILDHVPSIYHTSSNFIIYYSHSVSFWYIHQLIRTACQHWSIFLPAIFASKHIMSSLTALCHRTYWTRFQTSNKAAPEMMAFLFLTSWKMSFSDISEKLAVFKFQEPWTYFQLDIYWLQN